MAKPRVTFSMMPVVAVKILGEEHRGFKILPTTPADGGLVRRYLKWSIDNNVFPIVGGHSGGGTYLGYYSQADATKVHAWLQAQGVIEEGWK